MERCPVDGRPVDPTEPYEPADLLDRLTGAAVRVYCTRRCAARARTARAHADRQARAHANAQRRLTVQLAQLETRGQQRLPLDDSDADG